ncbi:MAG: DUF3320 domain-containing protein [Rhodoglobus sp.]
MLAAHQWVRQPAHLATELLAAHVQPNHPAIAALLSESSEWLETETGDGSLEGYQSDENRVDLIARAIFEAMKARGIRYSNPPASWGDSGQKIRTPEEVLEGRVGTCLDTTVVFAAALEQAGIHPLLWLLEGHAFVGYWRQEASLGAAANSEALEAINLVDLGYIGVIETTMITTAHPDTTFEEARRSPETSRLQGRPDDILGITDVVEARRARIIPLPARTVNDDNSVTVTEYRPAAGAAVLSTEYGKGDGATRSAKTTPYRVAQWKNSLLDLSLRNRLINFGERGKLSLAIADADAGYAEDIVNDNKSITLIPSDEIPQVMRARGIRYGRDLSESDRSMMLREKGSAFVDVTDAAYLTRLRGLAYKAKTIEQETGANNLYLAFGTLLWDFNGRELRSPLILVPVRLEIGRGGKYRIVLDESGSSTPNYCLLEKLRQVHGLTIGGLAEPTEDASGIDLDAAFRSTREALERARLPFRVEATADLSILQFAKFRLWKDLDDNWEEFAKNPLVSHLIHTPTAQFIDPVSADDHTNLDNVIPLVPVPADSSQLAAVAAASAGQTFVLEGPPGTGKSQTITNLLVRAVAEGKKVLFVAEKKAALQVVQRRLEEVGLGAFALDIHDKGSRPAAVRAQIKAALQHRVAADPDGLRTATETLQSSRRTLDRYATRLHEKNAAGLSYYSARERLLASDEALPPVEIPRTLVTSSADQIEVLRDCLRQLPDTADPARPSINHPWGFIDSAAGLDQERMLQLAGTIDSAIARVERSPRTLEVLRLAPHSGAITLLSSLMLAPAVQLETIDTVAAPDWSTAAIAALDALSAESQGARTDHPDIDPAIFDEDLDQIHADALAADTSRFFGRKKRRIAVRSRVESYFLADTLPHPRKLSGVILGLSTTAQRLRAAQEALDTITGLEGSAPENPWLPFSPDPASHRIGWLKWLGATLSLPVAENDSYALALRVLYQSRDVGAELAPPLKEIASSWIELQSSAGTSAGLLDAWRGAQEPVPQWIATRDRRDLGTSASTGLKRWADLLEYVEPLRDAGLHANRVDILAGVIASEVALPAFDLAIAQASLDERASSTTLDTFDASAHEKAVLRYVDSSDLVRESLVTSIPSDILNGRSFSASSTSGQMGNLSRQLDRQRGGLGVRALLDQFGPLIAEILPCVLMSPESVARFYGARSSMFDIVVFDEASQIRVADAIGAMGRARSVVVVGDSKQMPPTSFAEATISDESESREPGSVQDEESILSECVSAQVPSLALTWHYRSQDESLIQFSNEHYYGNLSTFPSPLHGVRDDGLEGHGISLVQLNGRFLRSATGKDLRTNPVEARAIVDEIQRRFWASPNSYPSLGVVTFNAQQRALIESLLRDAGDTRIIEALEAPDEGLFVKNLENVQGDERDTILFSTAFSVNDRGILPLNFGPVSQAGGERRLNVAITRARRQVILFSSFEPSELRAEESSSVGLRHLKAYLEMAAGRSSSAARRFGAKSVDRHREQIADRLRQRGLSVTTDVGLSDFKVDLSLADQENPESPIMAVLLDNSSWAERRTVADRDGLPTAVLRNLMKWPGVSRVWMPAWIADPNLVVDQLVAEFQRASDRAALDKLELSAQMPDEPFESVMEESQSSTTDTRTEASTLRVPSVTSANQREFEPWLARAAGGVDTLDRLPSGDATARVEEVIREIVHTEGPVHLVRLAKLTASAFGLERVAQSRMVRIVQCIPSDLRVKNDRVYLWPPNVDPTDWHLFRRSAMGSDRPLEHVHPTEIANAMVAMCIRDGGLFEDELRRETLRMFGVVRMTANMAALLDAALKVALETGRLELTGVGVISVPG